MNGRMRWIGLGIVVGVLALAWRAPLPEPRREPHNCRFWALIGSDYPDSLIRDHLRDGGAPETLDNLMELARDNYDGWGLGYFPSSPWEEAFRAPILRRGGPAADNPHEPEYGLAVDEMNEVRPRAVVAHVRRGTSGHFGIPNPHPFQHRGMIFAHNGTTVVSAMESYLDKYLSGHPPDYTHGAGTTGHIDSELYFLCLLKYIDEHPEQDFATALAGAVQNFVATIGGGSLNFVLTDGDTLYALHFDYGTNPVAYYPRPVIGEGGRASPFWAVASQPMGSETSAWATIPNYTLGVFVSGAAPQFRAIGDADFFPAPPQSGGDGAAGDSGGGAGPGIETGRETGEETGEETREEMGETPPGHNCRFWALVGGGYPEGMIDRQLYSGTQQNLRLLAQANEDGWGLGYFLADPQELPLRMPVIRRGGPPANSAYEPEYREAVEELEGIRPRAALAHVRRGTSGHFGIPDPHPFLHEGLLFAHNG
ncbi:MAG: class II glutamine amidotransferase, partial [Candidatus Eisenbacteria bacterium]